MCPNRCYFESRKSGHVNATNRPSFPYLLVAVVCLLSGLLIRNGFVNGRLRSRYEIPVQNLLTLKEFQFKMSQTPKEFQLKILLTQLFTVSKEIRGPQPGGFV